jgi:hypothetical protein
MLTNVSCQGDHDPKYSRSHKAALSLAPLIGDPGVPYIPHFCMGVLSTICVSAYWLVAPSLHCMPSVSAYCYICAHPYACIYICSVLTAYMGDLSAICVSACSLRCVPSVSVYCYMGVLSTRYVSTYCHISAYCHISGCPLYYICVRILPCTCLHPAILVSAYCYMCAHPLIRSRMPDADWLVALSALRSIQRLEVNRLLWEALPKNSKGPRAAEANGPLPFKNTISNHL